MRSRRAWPRSDASPGSRAQERGQIGQGADEVRGREPELFGRVCDTAGHELTVTPVGLADIEAAAERIRGVARRTPLIDAGAFALCWREGGAA